MFLGRYFQGQTIDLRVQARDVNGTPAAVAAAPVVKVWRGATLLLNAPMPVLDRYQVTGLFHLPLFLGGAYTAGNYQVVYYYVAGSRRGVEVDGFEVTPGGHGDGDVISMYFLDRPDARFLVQKLTSGKIIQGRNPTV